MAKHRAGSLNAGGSPQEVAVCVSHSRFLPTSRDPFKVSVPSISLYHTRGQFEVVAV